MDGMACSVHIGMGICMRATRGGYFARETWAWSFILKLDPRTAVGKAFEFILALSIGQMHVLLPSILRRKTPEAAKHTTLCSASNLATGQGRSIQRREAPQCPSIQNLQETVRPSVHGIKGSSRLAGS